MTKCIKVTECTTCPYLSTVATAQNYVTPFCRRAQKQLINKPQGWVGQPMSGLPNWCPLSDCKE